MFINCKNLLNLIKIRGITMGRIKTKLIKALTGEVYDKYKEEFTTDFAENKKVLNSLQDGASKKLRNTIAGFATRKKKYDIKNAL